jgi:hypothetical protein
MFRVCAVSLMLMGLIGPMRGQSSGDALENGFKTPPNSAKPRVWWHWMNGNITKEGIKLDLEWMNRVGIGGFQNFDASLGTPQLVDKRLVYMTPEWKDAFLFTTKLALGEAQPGDEKGGVERNQHRRRQAVRRRVAASPHRHRPLSEHPALRFPGDDQRSSFNASDFLLRHRSHRVSRTCE